MGDDQPGHVLGVEEPGSVAARHLIQASARNLVNRRPGRLDREVRIAGSENEQRGGRDPGEPHG